MSIYLFSLKHASLNECCKQLSLRMHVIYNLLVIDKHLYLFLLIYNTCIAIKISFTVNIVRYHLPAVFCCRG
jgi:hypothetical protein